MASRWVLPSPHVVCSPPSGRMLWCGVFHACRRHTDGRCQGRRQLSAGRPAHPASTAMHAAQRELSAAAEGGFGAGEWSSRLPSRRCPTCCLLALPPALACPPCLRRLLLLPCAAGLLLPAVRLLPCRCLPFAALPRLLLTFAGAPPPPLPPLRRRSASASSAAASSRCLISMQTSAPAACACRYSRGHTQGSRAPAGVRGFRAQHPASRRPLQLSGCLCAPPCRLPRPTHHPCVDLSLPPAPLPAAQRQAAQAPSRGQERRRRWRRRAGRQRVCAGPGPDGRAAGAHGAVCARGPGGAGQPP